MKKYIIMAAVMLATGAQAQDRIHYTGTELSNPQRHDGGLSPVVGVHNIQTLRANREKPSQANGDGWTYNHQPMLAYWQGSFYMHYLCDPVDEHVPPSRTMLQTSKDGYLWTDPVILFPEYPVPDGYTKPGREDKAQGLVAIAHQRVGWYVAKDGTLLAMGNYGVALDRKDDPNDGNGIGRVVREIKADAEPRMDMHDGELNRVLGGGMVPGSLVLLGGEPGIGKSTLVLQTVLRMHGKRILYVSGEESARQIKLRADRLMNGAEGSEMLVLCETCLEQVFEHIEETQPDLVVMDSIQTMQTESVESSPGSLSQIRECAASLLRYAKGGGGKRHPHRPYQQGRFAGGSQSVGAYRGHRPSVRGRPAPSLPHSAQHKEPFREHQRTGHL